MVHASALYTGDEVVRDAYVVVRNGRVKSITTGLPPEAGESASLILGGEGRVAAPGLTMAVDAVSYPFRFMKPRLPLRAELYDRLEPGEALKLALPGVYEAHMAGATTVVVEYPSPEIAYLLAERVGGRYGILAPACSSRKTMPEALPSGVVYGEGCGGGGDVEARGSLGYAGGSPVLAYFNRPSYRVVEEDAWTMSERLRAALGLRPARIREGERAEIVVYNTGRPPAMMLHAAPDGDVARVYSSGARVESLLVGETVLVDGGEHLYIVEKHFSEAARLASRLQGRR